MLNEYFIQKRGLFWLTVTEAQGGLLAGGVPK